MDENKSINVGTEGNIEVTTNTTSDSNSKVTADITMTQEDYDKKIQSEGDKIRTHYSKEIKKLEDKIKELSPIEKSDAENELDNRLAQLEIKQKEIENKERFLILQTSLQAKNLDKIFADYIKSDIDIDAFETVITNTVNDRVKSIGYIPTSHQTNTSVTADKWKKMSYSEKEKVMNTNPELANTFLKK